MTAVELLDPRHDPEPPYWEELRVRAGLRADWSWELLRIAAWCASAPLLVSVLREGTEVLGVVCASFAGPPARRRYATGRPVVGALYVQSPGTSAVPGWWFAERLPAAERAELCATYLRAMRRDMGPRCRGVVWRHAAAADLAFLRARRTLLRGTDAVAVLPLSWPDPERWLASLRRGRRQDLRRQRRLLDADPDLVVRHGPVDAAGSVRLAGLLRFNEAKYADRHDTAPTATTATAYLAALLRRTDVVTVTYRDHTGRPLAFGACLDHPVAPVARFWAAVPSEHGGRQHLYFDFYQRLVAWAAAAGRKEINFGRTKLEVKADLGGELQPRYSVAVPCWR